MKIALSQNGNSSWHKDHLAMSFCVGTPAAMITVLSAWACSNHLNLPHFQVSSTCCDTYTKQQMMVSTFFSI